MILVSIHAPRVGERHLADIECFVTVTFQSTLPAWGSDAIPSDVLLAMMVSIHAPRVGERQSVYMTSAKN